jgi:hypothetical protein
MAKKVSFLSTLRVKNVHMEVGGGQKRAKLCPRSHLMSTKLCEFAGTDMSVMRIIQL